jgi:PAS domain-containing protein
VNKAFITIFFILCYTAKINVVNAQSVIQENSIENIINSASCFIDSTASMSLEDILKSDSSKFKKQNRKVLGNKISTSAFWVRFHAVNLSHSKVYLNIDNPTLDSVYFFYYDPYKSAYVKKIYGYNLPIENQDIKCTGILFELPYCGTNGADYYLRVVSRKVITLPASMGNLKPLIEGVFRNYALDALYFGLMAGMILFNLFFAFSFKSRTYFLYVGFAFFLSIYLLYWKGYTMFLNNDLKYFFGNYSNSFAALSVIFSIWFSIFFLKIREFSKKLLGYCFLLTCLNIFVIILEVAGNKSTAIRIQVPVTFLTSLSFIAIAAVIYLKGLKHARFYLLANSLYQISLLVFLSSAYDLIPWTKYHSHILPLGHALEITILAIALVDRVNQLRKEKEEVIKESLAHEKELNEELQTREEDLAASENELKNANHQLRSLNQDLIGKNGQLIDNQIHLFTSLEEARVLNNKLSLREEELTSKEEELRRSLDELNLIYKQLKESEQMLKLAQKIAKTGSWKFNLKTRELEFSEALYEIFEIPIGTKITREVLAEILGEEIINLTTSNASESVNTKNPFSLKYKFHMKNGEVKHMYSIGTPFIDMDGEIKEIYGNTQDVSEIRKAEELLNKQTSELIESNKKAAEFKLLALRSVMNPHFLFNSLNSIQYFITKNDREQALTYLAMFSKLIRSILNSSIANYNSLQEELEILKLYVNLEQLRFKNKFRAEFDTDNALKNEEILIPSLLLQPYIENAIIHGLFHKEGNGGLLKISFRKKGNKVLCVVEDNGIGRAKALEIKKANNLHKSIGMLVTKERIDLINNDEQVSVVITDLFDSENQPKGTKVEVLVSYR